MQFTHYLFGYVGKIAWDTLSIELINSSVIGTALCLVGLSLSLCSVYVFTRRQMVGFVRVLQNEVHRARLTLLAQCRGHLLGGIEYQ